MPEKKPHLLFNGNPEATADFRYAVRFYDPEQQNLNAPNIDRYTTSLLNISTEIERRSRERNLELSVPKTILCIDIEFYGWFNCVDFENIYRVQFGLSPIRYYDLNRKGLFAIIEPEQFNFFLDEIRKCIASNTHENPDYNTLIRYIKTIRFHNTEKILESLHNIEDTVYLSMIDTVELHKDASEIVNSLRHYLETKEIPYVLNYDTNEIEIASVDFETVTEIAKNFDVVHSVNSSTLLLTRPSRYGTNIREYPFTISQPEVNAPIVGVIDTGVSEETPLAALLINNDNRYALNSSNPRVDEAFNGDGHGTAVAAFVALGDQLAGEIKNELTPDCKILSIKILNGSSGKISNSEILNLIRRAHAEHNIRIFTLTTCYNYCLKKGESQSEYAYALDKLTHELDILIFICTANYTHWNNDIYQEYPRHYLSDECNFCSPAESINNITIGALGDNLEPEMPITVTKFPLSSAAHPAAYTRKYHLDYERLTLKNSKVCKPDLIYSGGNLACFVDQFGTFVEDCSEAALQYLSANRLEPILRGVGTSFSTALVANLAVKLVKSYPTFRMSTIKALLINGAENIPLTDHFNPLQTFQKNYLVGHGKPQLETSLYSNDNACTIIIEDSIQVGKVKCIPIVLPDYLNTVNKNKSLIGFEATLCYNVLPIKNNQLGYCPVNIAFGLFKNTQLENNSVVNNRTVRKGISGGKKEDICFNLAWSQDAYYKSKMLSNTQKVSFYIKRDQIIQEGNTFKLAISSHFHKILPAYVIQSLPQEYQFSLVIRLWENRKEAEGKLYGELVQLNSLEILGTADADQDLDLEADLEH